MGLMDFFKKKGEGSDNAGEEFNFNTSSLTADNTGLPPSTMSDMQYQPQHELAPSMSMSSMGNTAFGQPSYHEQSSQQPGIERDMQMISLKLDAIKSEIDAMNQRLKNLEMIAEREQSKVAKKWY